MDIQIGKRRAFYCNVKVILLFLVIYGHLIEARIEESVILMWQYRVIYAMHMPMFAFVSGMFLKSEKACIAQFRTALEYYVLCQAVVVAVSAVAGRGQASFFTPCWHLWYLLSLFLWAVICMMVVKIRKLWMRVIIILLSIVLACVCGYVDSIGRFLSLSRTICFLPFVLLGQILPVDIEMWEYRMEGVTAGLISVVLLLIIASMLPVEFFYQASSYEKQQLLFGAGFRFISMLVAVGLGFFLLTVIPAKRLVFSKAGVDTFGVYLLHGPVVLFFRKLAVSTELFTVLAPVLAVFIYFILYELCRWKSKWCRII